MQSMLSIFEPVTEKVESSFCSFCGEFCSNSALKQINHGIIFNGWCIKAMLLHNHAQRDDLEALAWIKKHGIDPNKSRFEQRA